MHQALNELYAFNMERIYKSEKATRDREKIRRAMKAMFDVLSDCLEHAKGDVTALENGEHCGSVIKVFAEFLRDDIRNFEDHSPEQLVIDFVAGMTDSFFQRSVGELFLPEGTV